MVQAISGASKLCDHIIAVDGAYFAFPHQRARSGAEQLETIVRTCDGLGVGLTLHVPQEPWIGNEVEKRDFMFRLGEHQTQKGDWYLIFDADEVLVECREDVKGRLMACEQDAASITLWERAVEPLPQDDYRSPIVRLYRALDDIHITRAHYRVTSKGRELKQSYANFTDVVMEHHTRRRDPSRLQAKQTYDTRRVDLQLEE